MSRCNCFSDTLEKVRPKIEESIPEGAADFSISWQNEAFFLSGGDYVPVNPRIEIEYRKPKKGGGHAKNLTRDSISILCNYCPYCGRKLEKEGGS